MLKKTLITGLLFGWLLAGANAQDKTGDLAIVINKASTLENVTSAELAKIFRAEKSKGPDGVRYVLAARETGSPERAAALAGIYQMSEDEYAKYFLQATFIGLVRAAPEQITSAAGLKAHIAKIPGTIGYLRASEVDDTVKVVKVDGKLPGEPDYKLKIK